MKAFSSACITCSFGTDRLHGISHIKLDGYYILDLPSASMFWGVLFLVMLGFSWSHLSPFLKVLKQLRFVGSCVSASLGWTDSGVAPPKDVSLRCWSWGAAMWTVDVGTSVKGSCYCATSCPVSFVVSWIWKKLMPGNFCSCCKEVMYSRKKKVLLVLTNVLFGCLVEIDLFWLPITETIVLMSFFSLTENYFYRNPLYVNKTMSCKTKQTLPIRLPLWGSVQCWYFHESVFQNLKGNNTRLYGWWLAGKTTKSPSAWQHDFCCTVNIK